MRSFKYASLLLLICGFCNALFAMPTFSSKDFESHNSGFSFNSQGYQFQLSTIKLDEPTLMKLIVQPFEYHYRAAGAKNDDMSLTSSGFSFYLQNTGSNPYQLFDGKVLFELNDFVLNNMLVNFGLKNFSFKLASTLHQDKLDLNSGLSFDEATFEQRAVGPIKLSFEISNLPAEKLQDALQKFIELEKRHKELERQSRDLIHSKFTDSQPTEPDYYNKRENQISQRLDKLEQQQLQTLFTLLTGNQQLNLGVFITKATSKAEFQLSVNLPNMAQNSESLTHIDLLNGLTGSGKLVIDKSLTAKEIPALLALSSFKKQMLTQQIETLIQQGYFIEKQNQYIANFKIENGILQINEQKIPLNQL